MQRMIDRAGWALAGALAIVVVLVAARAIEAGPLDPPGPVGSTMKTLADLPPSWHQLLAANNVPDECNSARFTCVMNKQAALDNETGLVWQLAPSATTVRWTSALCTATGTGGRGGWRLPTASELTSLAISGGLPTGHPFSAPSAQYWSSSLIGSDPQFIQTFNPVASVHSSASRGSATSAAVWCVRGGGAAEADAQTNFPQVWRARQLDADDGAFATTSSRFFNIGNTSAVTDRETGLTWQVTPDTATSNWVSAVNACGRFSQAFVSLGWRLPTLAELLSLYSSGGTGSLPTGHPFVGIAGVYWTRTTDVATAANAYTVDTAQVETSTSLAKTATTARHWCVRGGPGE